MAKLTPKLLAKASRIGHQKLDTVRRSRLRYLAQFVGRFYGAKNLGSEEDRKASPINLMWNAITTYVPNHVYNNPSADVDSRYLQFRGYANLLGMATDHAMQEMKIRMSLRKVLTDALVGVGFMKTGIGASDQVLAIDEGDIRLGKPFADRVDLDDMIIDPLARDQEEVMFIGNKFRIQRDVLLDMGIYDNGKLERLIRKYEYAYAQQSVEQLSESKHELSEANEIFDYVELQELYVPGDNIIITMPWIPGGEADDYLRIVEYDGPDTGPYHMLGFAHVPGNLLPVAPAGIWYDLHVMANRIARKIGRQAERSKSVLAYEASAVEDAQEVMDADDGETIRVDNIDALKEINYGGVTEDSYEYLEWVKKNFSEQSNNMDLLSGQRSNEPTATQAEMLQANTSVRLADSQNLFHAFVEEVVRDVAYFLHTDPLIELPMIRRVRGMDEQVVYSPEMRQGEWFDYMIKVKPFSMARQDPNMKVRRVMEFAQNVIPAAAQAFQMLGPAFNIEGFLANVAKQVQLDDADEIINSQYLQMMIGQQLQALSMGVPLPQKVAAGGRASFAGMLPSPMPGINIGQPNPGQRGPTGGVTVQGERNEHHQDAAAEIQRSMKPSLNAQAARLQ